MDSVEITGKTLEAAIQTAAEELQVPVESVKYEVVEEGGGIFGLGTKVKIHAWAAEETAQEEATEAVAEVEPAAAPVEEAEAPEISGNMDADAQLVLDMVEKILAAMQIEGQPELKIADDEEILVNLVGPDVAILIGKHGQTLDALQYLLVLALNKNRRGNARITLDAEGYRDRHRQMIEARARDFAEQVKQSGQEAVLDPLPARDRRIIHTFLADDPEVETYSEGVGEDRRLVISPKK